MTWNKIIPQAETVAAVIRTGVLWLGLMALGACPVLVWMVIRGDFERGLTYRATQVIERVVTSR